MRETMFSILVVSLNSGDKLVETVDSILKQTYTDYEVVVKDGGSKDDSLSLLEDFLQKQPQETRGRVRVIQEPDGSIYEGMNQATGHAKGQYYCFLNCGDLFASDKALAQAAEAMKAVKEHSLLFYGDILDALRGEVVKANPRLSAFDCYRNLPCHQACIYHYSLFEERGYKTEYKVRGDYEHFLWCYFCKEANPAYIDVVLASYEGGGYSETKENLQRSKKEHKEITQQYMSKGQLLKYKLILLLTLAPLRTKLAESPRFAGFYQKCKSIIYKR